MISLWPAAVSRISCLNTRTIFPTCRKVDSLAARLAQRSYSNSPALLRRKDGICVDIRPPSERCQNMGLRWWGGRRDFATERVVTKFQALPRNYKDGEGLPFRAVRLGQKEVEEIFGKVIDVSTANRLLRVLHGRRVAGTLEDPNVVTSSTIYEQSVNEVALEWLRNHVPVDEVECAGQRAELELAEIETEILHDAERIGLYKPNSDGKYTEGDKKSVYGESGLDAIRKAREAKLDEKEAAEGKAISQADEIRYNTGTLEKISARSNVELRRPGENAKLRHYLERAKVLPNTPPEMSKFARLWPSGLVVAGVMVVCYVFAQVYTPPKNSSKIWPDMPPSAATIIAIILANSLVLLAWRVPPMFRVLNKYFITVPGYPFPLSLIGNVFSHQGFSHFTVNMVVLWFVGTRLHDEVGRGNFLAIYLACGAFGSFTSLTSWVVRSNFVSSSLGASGALSGIIACYLWLNSKEKITLFGVFPPESWPSLSAMGFLAILIGLDIAGLSKPNKMVTVDHWAHLGGYAAGIGSAELLRRRMKWRREVEMERRRNLGILDRIKEGRL